MPRRVTGLATKRAGRLEWDDRPAFLRALEGLPDGRVSITVGPPARAGTDPQRRWWFGVAVPLIADAMGHDRDEREEVHQALVNEYFGTAERPSLIPGAPPIVVPNVRFSKATAEQRAALMDWVVRWAAEKLNVIIPLPDDPICIDIMAQDEVAA